MFRALVGIIGGLLLIAVLIGIGVVLGAVFFGDEEDATVQDRLENIRRDLNRDVDQIIDRVQRNEDVSGLRETVLERCLRKQEELRENQGDTGATERLGDVCDEIRNAPDNATRQWEEIRRRLDELRS